MIYSKVWNGWKNARAGRIGLQSEACSQGCSRSIFGRNSAAIGGAK